ncbi:hypothetical protein [Streptomyces sp. NPDC001537]
MPADEVTHGTDVDESRARTGPRHAAPKKPLFTRFHMPAGKAIATVAMPTAVLMGMGFTSSLALADSGGGSATTNSQKADEYKDCVAALDGSTASPSPSASASSGEKADKATPSPSPSAGTSKDSSDSTSGKTGSAGSSGSSDSGSGDKATPKPSASDSSSKDTSGSDTATPSPSASASSGGGLLDDLGNAIGSIFTGGSSTSSASPTPTPSASASTSKDSASSGSSGTSASDTVKDTTKKVTDTVNKTVKDTTDTATKAAEEATKAAQEAAGSATSSPSPSASSSTDAANCETATDDTGGVDNKVPVADAPWYLSASSLTLNKADYQGIVKVRTANGTVKKVLKYVISGGTDIGDLHQTVKDTDINKTYHVQAAKGSHSTITGGTTTMYTESISGNLFGLIPLTFTPDSPPPLNIPFIYFTNVKVVQAAQFGGTLHVPGMHVYTTDGTG